MCQRTAEDDRDSETKQRVIVEGDEEWVGGEPIGIPMNVDQAPKPNRFQQPARLERYSFP